MEKIVEKHMDRRVARTKRNIRNALLELTSKKSLNDITVTELAERADVDRKTFYNYYDTVTDVVNEMIREVTEEVRVLLAEKEQLTIEGILIGLNEIMQKNTILYQQIATGTPMSYLKESCKNILKQELKTAYYKNSGLDTATFRIYSEYIASGIIGVYTDWLASPEKITLNRLTILASNAVQSGWNEICK